MSWFLCIMSQKPFLEWEIEKFLKTHPYSKNTIIDSSFYFSYDCRKELLSKKIPSVEDPNLRIVMGRGYISKNTGYSQADEKDWEKLLKHEFTPKDIDGHYMAINLRKNYFQATNDLYGHYPIYYVDAEDYILISNVQQYIAAVLPEKEWDYTSIASMTLLPAYIDNQPYLTNISRMENGATITIRKNEIKIANRKLNFIAEEEIDTQNYLFSLKKAFELQLDENDFMSIPFENNQTSRFAFSVWCHKPKKNWGLYLRNDKTRKKSQQQLNPDKYIDSLILNDLKIMSIPDFISGEEVFRLYKEYVLKTGLSDFPMTFGLAGSFKTDDFHEINLLSCHSNWLFESNPLSKTEKIYSLLKSNKYLSFKFNYVYSNYFFTKDLYNYLSNETKVYFKQIADELLNTETVYDKYYFLFKKFHINNRSVHLAWLNDYRTFYSPGMFYSLAIKHLYQRSNNKKLAKISCQLHTSFAEESKFYPKPVENKDRFLDEKDANMLYFPMIIRQIGAMIEISEEVPYYDYKKLIKLYKNAKNGNKTAVKMLLKWTAFEIWREFLE